MTEKYAGHYYTAVDTTIPEDTTVKLDELSGRVGDNMRPVYLQLMQTSGGTQVPWNLSGKTIQLGGKDASGVVKTTNTATVVNAAKGLVNLQVPGAFYQASGAYQTAYLQILDGSNVISTVNVDFNVFDNGLAISTSQSDTYLASVAATEQSALAMYDPLTTQTKALQAAQDTLTTEMKALQSTIDSTGVAKIGSDNTFTGANTFNGSLTAKTITADSLAGGALTKIQAMINNLVSDTGFTSNGINFQNGASGNLVMRQTRIGSVNEITINGGMQLNESLEPWGPRRNAFQLPALAGAQNVQILNNEQPADGNVTLWWGLNGTTLTLQNINNASQMGSNGKGIGQPGWWFQVGLTLRW